MCNRIRDCFTENFSWNLQFVRTGDPIHYAHGPEVSRDRCYRGLDNIRQRPVTLLAINESNSVRSSLFGQWMNTDINSELREKLLRIDPHCKETCQGWLVMLSPHHTQSPEGKKAIARANPIEHLRARIALPGKHSINEALRQVRDRCTIHWLTVYVLGPVVASLQGIDLIGREPFIPIIDSTIGTRLNALLDHIAREVATRILHHCFNLERHDVCTINPYDLWHRPRDWIHLLALSFA